LEGLKGCLHLRIIDLAWLQHVNNLCAGQGMGWGGVGGSGDRVSQ
jgi:hypothetical protein